MEIDKNNFCWISFPNGIQKFDGNSFENIPAQHGLPDDKFAKFFRCQNGDLLISHSKGISKYDIGTDNFSLVYKQPVAGQQAPIIIGEYAGTLYCYDPNSGTITAMSCQGFNIVSSFKTNLPASIWDVDNRLQFSDNIIDNKAAMKIGKMVYLLDLKEKKIIGQSFIETIVYSFTLKLKSSHEFFYYDTALQCWDFKTNSNRTIKVKGEHNKVFSRCVIFPWQNKMLISFNNQIFETDSTLQILKSELVNFQNLPVAGGAGIPNIKEDNFGNLYLQTVNGGIRKIIRNNYPIKYFGTSDFKKNNILAILPDKKNNRVLIGGTGGLFIFDTLQRLLKHIDISQQIKRLFIPNGIIQSGNGDYFIFITGSKVIYRLSKDLLSINSTPISSSLPSDKSYSQFFGNFIINNGKSAIFQTQHKLYRIDFDNIKISEHQFSGAYIMGGFWHKNMIISHGQNELIFLDGQTFKELKKIPFNEPSGVRCFASNKGEGIFIGSNKGIFKIDTSGNILQQWNKSTGLPDECIYAIAFDKEGSLWCSTNKGILKINKDNQVLQITKQDGLQENEFNTNVLAVAEDGEMYFGGTNGVSSFYPSAISSFVDNVNLIFTGIRANNSKINNETATWNLQHIKLPYRQNALAFDFIAMGNNNPGQYVYQYKMKGVDKEWIQNTSLQTVRYSLAPGHYVFQVYASRSFNINAVPMKQISIYISPPFWQTWWFRVGLGILAAGLFYYFINQRNKRKYAKKIQVLENERQLKVERERISKDLHDNLGAYANAVLYNAELLEKEKTDTKREELIGDLKFASKDIITALRETVWALKKEEYTAEECLLRIRNFIQPFAKYYSHIQFSVTGEAPAGLKLHYTKALNLVRIVQEAVSNSIKHAAPTIITINAVPDTTKWKLEVKDNGHGFNYDTLIELERGNGLSNMEHRAAESGFAFEITSNAENGTKITIQV